MKNLITASCMVVVLFVAVLVDYPAQAMRCKCDGGEVCKPLHRGCQPGKRPCGCCVECRRKDGEYCGAMTPPCEIGLHCVNPETGVGKIRVPWFELDFEGRCEIMM